MRSRLRVLLALCLCFLLALPSGLAEEEEGTFIQDPPAADGQVIPPLYETPDYVQWLLEVARAELGYQEERSGVTKYGTWSGDSTAEWCAEYLCWCVNQVDKLYGAKLLNQVFPNYTGTNVGRNWYLKQGRYIARQGVVPSWGSQWFRGETEAMRPNSYIPQPGDWMFFSTNALGDTNHVAMVEYCTRDEEGNITVHVLEGNNPSAVARNAYPLDHWSILGYGTVYDLADMVMRFGNEGEKVRFLQQQLVKAGLLSPQYTTGKYGALTTEAIQKFQKSQGLHVTGIADFTTQTTLNAYVQTLAASAP